jgi:maltose alpha-D-glucosyltransferase/alpha-amylase
MADLVMNHTSDQHPWFQEARRDRQSPRRDYYVWSDTDQKYKDARIIFNDTESSNWTWDPVARQYFWHRFFSHQPDLNFDNPRVRQEMLDVMAFWLDRGIDGFRVDAIPYLFEREGTNCENLAETHVFCQEMRRFVDSRYPGTFLLAEANQWPRDLVAYFGDGNEFHMAFNFPLMPRLFMALRREQAWPIIEIMDQVPAIPPECQWALFLRNHDELTLEMVTDDERDYMYREYAKDPRMRLNFGIRRRLASLMDNDRRQLELLYAILLSLPGSPVIYYGDEIGMGDNIYLGDRHGVRTPMQWTGDRNAGFSRADPSRLYQAVLLDPMYHYQAINVEAQLRSPTSLLCWLRRLIRLRKKNQVFGRGSLKFVPCENHKVAAYLREYQDQTVLVVNNLSGYAQAAELDLNQFQGRIPVELLGNHPFPKIAGVPYFLSLSPHSFFWFRLDEPQEENAVAPEHRLVAER